MAAKVGPNDPWFRIWADGRQHMVIQAHTWFDAREFAHKQYGDGAFCDPVNSKEDAGPSDVEKSNGQGCCVCGGRSYCEAIPGGPKEKCKP